MKSLFTMQSRTQTLPSLFSFIFLLLMWDKSTPVSSSWSKQDPASVVNSVGYGHHRLVDVGHLEDDGLSVPLVCLELQADLPDVGNPVVGCGHVVQAASRSR